MLLLVFSYYPLFEDVALCILQFCPLLNISLFLILRECYYSDSILVHRVTDITILFLRVESLSCLYSVYPHSAGNTITNITGLIATDWDVKLIFTSRYFHCPSGYDGRCNSRSHGDNSSEVVSRRHRRSHFVSSHNGDSSKRRRRGEAWRREGENFDGSGKPLGP